MGTGSPSPSILTKTISHLQNDKTVKPTLYEPDNRNNSFLKRRDKLIAKIDV